MLQDYKSRVEEVKQRLSTLKEAVDVDALSQKLRELEAQAAAPSFWDDQERARRVTQEISLLQEEIKSLGEIGEKLDQVESVLGEEALQEEVEKELTEIEKQLFRLEVSTFLSGKYDRGNAILSIHAGQGGTEAMDWALMLERMYMRYAQSQGWDVEVVDETPGEEAGVKSVTLLIKGAYAYGYLRGEAGTHRLVRQSPFNADRLRQTSFALVEVLPELEETPEMEIKDEDLEWQFFRASSQGGQNVQKVSTAVRLKHIPSGIVVTAQTERFQEQNRKIALSLLTSRLWEKKMQELSEKERKLKGEYQPAAWGTQIRSYVLHPYKMVKDLRTDVETSDTEGVLDGQIQDFIDAEIAYLGKER